MTGPVLCAVDISDTTSDGAVLVVAQQMADLAGVTLDVVTVVPDYGKSMVGSFFESDHHAKDVDTAKATLEATVVDVLRAEANSKIRHVVATGTAYEEVLKMAETTKPSLIVIGAHKPDFKDYLLGPNAARVVRHSNCSVYVVR
ncbi:MAG: universal stress protein [Paracoccaceae bacterium]|nr:universal stress protein [Paracoccaceae bacterium]